MPICSFGGQKHPHLRACRVGEPGRLEPSEPEQGVSDGFPLRSCLPQVSVPVPLPVPAPVLTGAECRVLDVSSSGGLKWYLPGALTGLSLD